MENCRYGQYKTFEQVEITEKQKLLKKILRSQLEDKYFNRSPNNIGSTGLHL